MLKEQVIALLIASNDGVRAHQRTAFAAYLDSVFSKAEGYDELSRRVAELEAILKKI